MDTNAIRFWSKVEKTPICWIWTGTKQRGYGKFWVSHADMKNVFAHRYAWEFYNGPIPKPLVIDHLCRIKCCVNPAHLEVVTLEENSSRGNIYTNRTECVRGHPFDGESRHKRTCSICLRATRLAITKIRIAHQEEYERYVDEEAAKLSGKIVIKVTNEELFGNAYSPNEQHI